MSCKENLHVGARLCLLRFPHPDAPIEAATSEQAAIRAPGQLENRAGMLPVDSVLSTLCCRPEAYSCVITGRGDKLAIGGPGDGGDSGGVPALPEQHATLHVPQLDHVIPTHADQGASIWAERKCKHTVDVGLPDQV